MSRQARDEYLQRRRYTGKEAKGCYSTSFARSLATNPSMPTNCLPDTLGLVCE